MKKQGYPVFNLLADASLDAVAMAAAVTLVVLWVFLAEKNNQSRIHFVVRQH